MVITDGYGYFKFVEFFLKCTSHILFSWNLIVSFTGPYDEIRYDHQIEPIHRFVLFM